MKKRAYLECQRFRMYILFFFDKHHKKSYQQKHTGNPDGPHAENGNAVTADTCADGKK